MAFLKAATRTGSLISLNRRRIMPRSPFSFPAMLA
jgi:hypothetical protein